jgi:hypothetical protein
MCVDLDLSWWPLTLLVVLSIPGGGVLGVMAASV